MMKRIYPLMFVLFLALAASGVLFAGARATLFLNLPSLLIVVLLSLVLSLCSFSPAEIGHAFALAFRRTAVDQRELRTAILYFRSLQWYLIASGLIGFFVGLITILAGLGTAATLGSGLAISLLTVLYSLLLAAVVAVPFRTGLERKVTAS